MASINVGVLRGGPSSEYDVSLDTGASVLKHLPEKYSGHDILIDKKGIWHRRGTPVKPVDALSGIDAVFVALHGEYGEDGTLQKLLDQLRVPYTGSGALASAFAMNKVKAKEYAKGIGMKTAQHIVVEMNDNLVKELSEIFRTFPQPCVIKPLDRGSSVGVIISRTHADLVDGVHKSLEHSSKVLIEEYISGREATCGVLENYRGEKNYSMLPIEIIPPKEKDFFDYEAKYTGITQEICPGNFTDKEKEEIQGMAKLIHEALGCRHYSRSDFIISPRGIYYLETNTLPGLTSESLVPKSLVAAGCSFPEFLDHLITLARTQK
ncbi:MAG: D-alanine--D-alanine ligase [Candidatus Pacebacteria bacterium]|jgi:D-alanine-D-alanine ligase|nr:D-alanine--D-alanine ligase [bacterium]MDP6527859.1 D-alanine--D-alanine ligase [Candidatus Paceibacterota bacterium]MDP6659787.1 D-alanine--D-alanine ligase [Candidatus Paceibacterota bacterium]|tara:strand:+ start:8552 stop:9517 length:966 start_codon:yes stop_codon:yes gene_type:complete